MRKLLMTTYNSTKAVMDSVLAVSHTLAARSSRNPCAAIESAATPVFTHKVRAGLPFQDADALNQLSLQTKASLSAGPRGVRPSELERIFLGPSEQARLAPGARGRVPRRGGASANSRRRPHV